VKHQSVGTGRTLVIDDIPATKARQRVAAVIAVQRIVSANVRRVEPFHFSPRYAGEEGRMVAEVMAAFGRPCA
jgi:ribonuclease Z